MRTTTVLPIMLSLCLPAMAQAHDAISTAQAPPAQGPYSQAILAGDTLYLAGQIAIDPETKIYAPGTIEEESRRVLQNLSAVLEAAGMTMGNVVSMTVYLASLDEFGAMNKVYAEFFGDAPPARATIQAARLPADARVEIAAIAVR
jgi:2-iminobutanoate/2-iminopropanoate deaminase